jgi:bifunctional UDP-N-acetylglucosamine pyrophosphorylase/glucosamine-1-phosphate N-acetyltransferase
MGGDKPKVLVELHNKPLIIWVIEAVQAAGIKKIVVVIGHEGEMVKDALQDFDVEFIWQHERLGTGHAVQQTHALLDSHDGPVAVLLGDVPRIQPETIRQMVATHCESKASGTVLTVVLDKPGDLGRIVRDPDGALERIVEVRDADDKIKKINEINTGAMCFYAPDLFTSLPNLKNANAQSEYYLTDLVGLFKESGLTVIGFRSDDPRDGLGANSPEQLEVIGRL